jgi:predicted aldo/keto reductase-like oxidoreductase
MKYGFLGTTGLKVSLIGFGGIPIQRGTVEEATEAISRAQDLGINFIDTARGYTVSENYIGEALKGKRDKWIIASKSMSRDKNSMDKDIDISLRNLKTDYIDLYQIHNVRTEEDFKRVLSEDGAYSSLERAKEQGKIGHIGITSHSIDILELALDTGKFETIMYPYNIVETQGKELFKRASGLSVGVIAMKPLAGGLLQDVSLALKFVLENQDVSTVIPGMATIEEVEANVKALNGIMLSEDEKVEIQKMAKELGIDFCRRCGYCQPCPQGVDIPSIFTLEAYKQRYNLGSWAESRYFDLKKTSKDCIKCGVCETRCPYDLPIRSMLERIKEIFGG